MPECGVRVRVCICVCACTCVGACVHINIDVLCFYARTHTSFCHTHLLFQDEALFTMHM